MRNHWFDKEAEREFWHNHNHRTYGWPPTPFKKTHNPFETPQKSSPDDASLVGTPFEKGKHQYEAAPAEWDSPPQVSHQQQGDNNDWTDRRQWQGQRQQWQHDDQQSVHWKNQGNQYSRTVTNNGASVTQSFRKGKGKGNGPMKPCEQCEWMMPVRACYCPRCNWYQEGSSIADTGGYRPWNGQRHEQERQQGAWKPPQHWQGWQQNQQQEAWQAPQQYRDADLPNPENEKQYQAMWNRAFSFDRMSEYPIDDVDEALRIRLLVGPYIPAATTLPISTRQQHLRNWYQEAKNADKNIEAGLKILGDWTNDLRSHRSLIALRVANAEKFEKDVQAQAASGLVGSDGKPNEAVVALKGMAEKIGDPVITDMLSQVANLLLQKTAQAQAPAPVPAPTSTGTVRSAPDSDRRPRLRRKTTCNPGGVPTAVEEATENQDVETESVSDSTSDSSTDGLTKQQNQNLKKKGVRRRQRRKKPKRSRKTPSSRMRRQAGEKMF